MKPPARGNRNGGRGAGAWRPFDPLDAVQEDEVNTGHAAGILHQDDGVLHAVVDQARDPSIGVDEDTRVLPAPLPELLPEP